jgi:hypothetical protein
LATRHALTELAALTRLAELATLTELAERSTLATLTELAAGAGAGRGATIVAHHISGAKTHAQNHDSTQERTGDRCAQTIPDPGSLCRARVFVQQSRPGMGRRPPGGG